MGLGLGGIIFSGLGKEYNVITSDLSFIIKYIKGEDSFLGIGGGIGGALASDFNWAREGKIINLTEAHAYGQIHVATTPQGSSLSFLITMRVGAFYIKTPVLIDISRELMEKEMQEKGKTYVKEKDSISGLVFIPSVGFNIPLVEKKVFLYLGLNLPLTTFLIFEPDYHPYVPSFNFALTF